MKIFGLIFVSLAFYMISCGEDCKFISISNESLPDAKINSDYTAQIELNSTCTYNTKSTSLKANSGLLPPGISMDASGKFTGKPNQVGKFTFTIEQMVCFGTNGYEATDCQTKSKEFTITVKE